MSVVCVLWLTAYRVYRCLPCFGGDNDKNVMVCTSCCVCVRGGGGVMDSANNVRFMKFSLTSYKTLILMDL